MTFEFQQSNEVLPKKKIYPGPERGHCITLDEHRVRDQQVQFTFRVLEFWYFI